MTRPVHPLNGADLRTLAGLIRDCGPPSRRYAPAVAGMFAAATARAPVSAAERAWFAARRHRASGQPPIFILGHWRSGTTHLFNLLAGAPELTYATPIPTGMPHDALLLGRALRPVLRRAIPAERHVDPMAVTETAPQEDEIGLANITRPSYYHGVYFPRHLAASMRAGLFFDGWDDAARAGWRAALHRFTDKVSLLGGGRRVLIKNPAHTAHVDEVLRVWPDAKIVHIVRNPYHVYSSTRRMMRDLLDMLALQDRDPDQVDETVHATYPRMMDALLTETRGLPERQIVTVSFEALTERPLDTVAHVADRLALDGRDGLLAAARGHLDSVAGYTSRTRTVAPEAATAVETHWGRYVGHWGYTRPAIADTDTTGR